MYTPLVSYTHLTILLVLVSTPLAALTSPIKALESNDAKVQALLAQESGTTLSSGLRAQVKEHINAVFDFGKLARLALGDHWQARSVAERAHFTKTFEGIIAEQNLTNFVKYYREGKIAYQSEEVDGTSASVTATVPVRNERIALVYRLHAVNDRWRVYDLTVDGLSTAESNRQKFERYINKHSYEKLIQQLEKQLARLQDQAAQETAKADAQRAASPPKTVSPADAAQTTAPATKPLTFTLAPGSAGSVKVGMLVDQLYKHVDRSQTQLVDRQQAGRFTPAIALRSTPNAPQTALIGLLRQAADGRWILGPISVSDPRYKTANGIGVGLTLAQLRAHHAVRVETLDANKRLVAQINTPGISFVLNTHLADLEGATLEQVRADPGLVPDSARILFIHLTDKQ